MATGVFKTASYDTDFSSSSQGFSSIKALKEAAERALNSYTGRYNCDGDGFDRSKDKEMGQLNGNSDTKECHRKDGIERGRKGERGYRQENKGQWIWNMQRVGSFPERRRSP